MTTEDGNFQWEWHGDHSTNGKPQEIKGLTAYCTPYGSLKADFTHETPKFNAIHNLLVHTQNVTFKDWTVNAGLYFGTHTFDIMGSSNITVDNFTSQGLGVKAYTKEELEGVNKNPYAQHSLYAEAVQIDYASYGASGMKDWSSTGLWRNDKEDLLPSSHITIKNSTFKGYNGKTGDAIIKGTNDTINLPYGATVGSHYLQNQPYKNITITNNTFDNTINFGKNATEPAIDPIHMYLTNSKVTTPEDIKTWNISGNQILNYEGVRSGNATLKRTDQYITWTESDNADDKISLPFSGNIKSEKSSLAYKNIVISNNKLDHTIDFGDKQNASVDPIALYLGGKTTAREDIKVTGNQITNYEGPKTGLGTIKENGNYITWTVSDEVQKPAETPKPVEPPKVETPKVETPKVEEPKVETPKVEEPKAETPKVEEPKVEEPKVEEPKAEEPKVEEPKAEEPKVEEPKAEEPKVEEPKVETPKTEEPKAEVKPEVKPEAKPETKPSKLEPKSEQKSDFTTAQTPSQTPAKQELPKTNDDVKVPLTISGIVLATAGFIALGYRKFFGKN